MKHLTKISLVLFILFLLIPLTFIPTAISFTLVAKRHVVTILVRDDRTGATSAGTNRVRIKRGDILTVSGAITPVPPSCQDCVIVLFGGRTVSHLSLGPLGMYSVNSDPIEVPLDMTSFWIQTVYTPTSSYSPIVNVMVAATT